MRKVLLVLAVAALAILSISCNQLKARDQLNKGVQAFTAAQYPEAVERFKTAVELDPGFSAARLYLATAYMQQYIPGADSPENNKMATAAFDNFKKVLEQNRKTRSPSPLSLPSNLNQKKWDEAQQWYEKLIAVEPQNADAYYSMGFIAWSKWYPVYGTARANLGMKQEDPGPRSRTKGQGRAKGEVRAGDRRWSAGARQGAPINPDYDDAMAYENLLVRERADLADTKEEYEKQQKIADDWVQKALATKKRKAEAKNKTGGNIVLDPNQK
jgi:tetratricopeptide (TPR) repeat protein